MNQLTPEQLDMIKKLQPKIIEAMGPVQYGDDYAIEVLPEQWEIETQGMIKKGNYNDYCTTIERCRQGYNILFIPKVYDWQNPERGLYKMIDWSKFYQEQYGPDGLIAIYENPFLEYSEELGITVKDHPLVASDPFTALLKILCYQEGV